MRSLAGRIAVVTGGTRGIGRATAEALVEAGATVIVTGRSGVEEVAAEIGASAATFDVADFDAVAAGFKAIAAEYGRIDILVANAGILEDALVGMIRPELVERILGVNVAGTIATVQAAARTMMRKGPDGGPRGGAIVLLASIVGEEGSAGQTVYAASKAAVAAIARSTAKELGPRGIRVNAVAPGLIDTAMIAHLPADLVGKRVADTALRRLGTPADVARVIRFLVSDEAAFVTGQVLGVDGGLVL
ncbi:3-oxoacyl-ACP reductase [Longispora fulva]|uniref:3-oxoacyl-[acyl-carrier protein] reductase n=1 Tax=Longispora fulva TaxID=619741 RepID=A0A8J7GV81_9ACTN|nr:SDR family NAD(P)-dependent oxidoreductase [Longispora fulva]MBG6138061.1 3-oxoacyl-[acyl-carrier protein] reductase [Longispora fulva]GIG60314.1 3-oxoacyl-ACP reductase [Longispora fulva]